MREYTELAMPNYSNLVSAVENFETKSAVSTDNYINCTLDNCSTQLSNCLSAFELKNNMQAALKKI
jgi:hypothetical protein